MRRLVLCLLLILVTLPLTAQDDNDADDGRGLIVEVNWRGLDGLGSLNPLRCSVFECQHILDLLFPYFLGVDHATGTYTTDLTDRNALVMDWEISADELVYTFTLRDDRFWSDGQPITAYDVFYSYLAIASDLIDSPYTDFANERISGVVPLDEYRVAVIYEQSGCDVLDYTNSPIIPAYVFDPTFAEQAAAFFDSTSDLQGQFDAWLEQYPPSNFASMPTHPFDTFPDVTSGAFQLVDVQIGDHIRLVRNDGALAFDYVEPVSGVSNTDRFINGESNIVTLPAYSRRADLMQMPDVQVASFAFDFWDFIGLNLADPENPQNAFDEEGNRIDQGHHPIFSDVRVRRAIQLGIDVQEIMDAAVQGYGTLMASSQIPTSWAYDDSLEPTGYDPVMARELLYEAGWWDANRNGVRECVACQHAETNRPLSFTLMVDSGLTRRTIAATIIQRQLRQIGFEVFIEEWNRETLQERIQQQTYDAYLTSFGETYPVNPDQTALFTSQSDVIGDGFNTGSYYNPEVDRLMEEARTLPGCDYDARTELYHEIQAILHEDQPFIWLYVPDEMYVAAGNVEGFSPLPHAPFWNIENWVIYD